MADVTPLLLLAAGFGLGLLIGILWAGSRGRLARELLIHSESQRQAETEALLDGVKLAFADISQGSFRGLAEQLQAGTQAVLAGERRLQGQELRAERAELELRLQAVLGQLDKLHGVVRELERDRESKMARLETRLEATGAQAEALADTTRRLAEALTSSRLRGQWGERLAEDVLRLAGFIENVSYQRQATTPDGTRPDFTFLLPQGLVLHMDVKFPFENWLKAVDAPDAATRQRCEQAFLRDARARIAEVETRGYVAPHAGTLDVALLFVPNEELAASLWRLAPGLLDEALAKGVIVVSPSSLFAVLAVIRRALDSFRLSRAAREMGAAVAAFRNAWALYAGELDRLGQKLDEAVRSHRTLTAWRRDRVERQLAILEGRIGAAQPEPEPEPPPDPETDPG